MRKPKAKTKTKAAASSPRFAPTAEQRAMVETLAGCGVSHADIGRVVRPGGVTPKTLRKYFREELDTGTIKANGIIAQALFAKAKGGDTISMIFWLKTRARWKETVVNEHTGKDGNAINITISKDDAAL